MATKPQPLREALREATKDFADACANVVRAGMGNSPEQERRALSALGRVAALVEQVPAEIEANDAE